MSEKKTFKNPQVAHIYMPYDGDEMFERTTDDAYIMAEDGGGHGFDRREWDVEVTLTKKVKPIQINSVVEDLIGNTGRVVAVQADKAWVHYYLSDGGQAVDFDCVEWLSELANVS